MGDQSKRANDFMRGLADSGGPVIQHLWSSDGPPNTAIKYIQARLFCGSLPQRIVLVEVFEDGGFEVFPALNIMKTDRLALALCELGDFEKLYSGRGKAAL